MSDMHFCHWDVSICNTNNTSVLIDIELFGINQTIGFQHYSLIFN